MGRFNLPAAVIQAHLGLWLQHHVIAIVPAHHVRERVDALRHWVAHPRLSQYLDLTFTPKTVVYQARDLALLTAAERRSLKNYSALCCRHAQASPDIFGAYLAAHVDASTKAI